MISLFSIAFQGILDPVYQFVVAVLQPFSLFYLITLVALVRLWRNSLGNRRWLLLVIVPFGIMGFLSLPVVGYLAAGSLEWRYPPHDEVPDDAGAIVVLSGNVRPPRNADAPKEVELGEDTLLRCLHAAKLYKAHRRPILVTGGKVNRSIIGLPSADVMHDFLVGQGVKEGDFLKYKKVNELDPTKQNETLENESASTYENALNSGEKILTPRGIDKIVLVTSAFHMRRSEGCFRALGFQVVPSPCDYHSTRFSWTLSSFLVPSPNAAAEVAVAAHEWLGMAWYWLWGRI